MARMLPFLGRDRHGVARSTARRPARSARACYLRCAMAEVDLLYRDATLRLGAHENVILAVWSDVPTLPQLRELGSAGRTRKKTHRQGVAFFDVVLGGTPRFTDEVRNEVKKQLEEDIF